MEAKSPLPARDWKEASVWPTPSPDPSGRLMALLREQVGQIRMGGANGDTFVFCVRTHLYFIA